MKTVNKYVLLITIISVLLRCIHTNPEGLSFKIVNPIEIVKQNLYTWVEIAMKVSTGIIN